MSDESSKRELGTQTEGTSDDQPDWENSKGDLCARGWPQREELLMKKSNNTWDLLSSHEWPQKLLKLY